MLDRHSEIIAHFIGQFDQAAEQSLFRLHYDAFRAQPRPDEEPGQLVDIRVHVSSELLPDTYFPDRISLMDADSARREPGAPLDVFAKDAESVVPVFPPEYQFDIHLGPWASHRFSDFVRETPTVDIPAPGGVFHFAFQQNVLVDNDILLTRPLELPADLAASRTDAALAAEFMPLAAVADALSPGDFTLGHTGAGTGAQIETLQDTFASVEPEAAPEGASVALVSLQDDSLPASGILVDGAEADAVPETLGDALDARKAGDALDARKADEAGTADEADGGAVRDGVVSGKTVIGPDDGGPHSGTPQLIETGGNLLTNTAATGFAPVDAAVIAVAGHAVSFTVISQVNVLSDRDTLVGRDEALCTGRDHPFESNASEGHNIASVSWEGTGGSDGDSGGYGPIGFGITEIEGDLVLTTHVFQINLVTDNDVISFETSFQQIEIGTGDNISVNAVNDFAFQYGFDMILVGGDMQTLVSMSQMNLLFDNDLVVDGDGAGDTVDTGGNLVWNQAQITWHGIDTAADEVSGAASDALQAIASGRQLDFDALKGEPLLAGKEVPLLLTIGGDLVFDYRLEQINILADADTVQLFAAEALDNGFAPVALSTGDNLLANVASLEIFGTDSTIMATGGVFSDLVIHQAGMYDTDDSPLDPDGSGFDLASEAVVFLADGMIDDAHPGEIAGGDIIIDTGGGSDTFDTLSGVVT